MKDFYRDSWMQVFAFIALLSAVMVDYGWLSSHLSGGFRAFAKQRQEAPTRTPPPAAQQLAPQQFSRDWHVDDIAFVQWSQDGFWYPAKVAQAAGGRYFVRYLDGDEEWTEPSRMAPENIRTGDRVYGRWQHGPAYYPGAVAERKGDDFHIKYDDGDEETTSLSSIMMKDRPGPMGP